MKNRIRDLREDADLTQKQVAQYLQMSQTGYSKYETVDYLMGRTDEKKPYPKGNR